MIYLVERKRTYAKYLATHSKGGVMFEMLNQKVEDGAMTQDERGKFPISETEWVLEQGSLEGAITESLEFVDKEALSEYGTYSNDWSVMDEADYNAEIEAHEERAKKALNLSNEPKGADGILAVDNFQDIENVPFSLKLRNATGDVLSGVTAVIENVPYSTIENVKSDAKITHTVTKDGTGYTHTFELLEALAAYASVNIDGDKLDAFGVGKADGNPKLYIK